MRGCEGQARPACRAAHDAAALVYPVKPVIEIQLRRRTVGARRVARVFPVMGAARLFALGFTVEPWLLARVFARADLSDLSVQRIGMSVIEAVRFGKCHRLADVRPRSLRL